LRTAGPWQSATTRAVAFKGGSNWIELPTTGPTWQVMRISCNRNWGHPELVQFLARFAPLAAKATGWKGILIVNDCFFVPPRNPTATKML